MKIVGKIKFGDIILNFYESKERPLFDVEEVYKSVGCSRQTGYDILSICENDDIHIIGERVYISECGLYTYIETQHSPASRKFRKIINEELVKLRREAERDICEQFRIWDRKADDYFFDDDGRLYISKTVAGGDVEQIAVPQ